MGRFADSTNGKHLAPGAGRWRRGVRIPAIAAAFSLALSIAAILVCGERRPGAPPAAAAPRPHPRSSLRAWRAWAAAWSPIPAVARAPSTDPLLAAIPGKLDGVMILRVNALLQTPLGKLYLACLDEETRRHLTRLRESGIDPSKDVEGVAFVHRGSQGGDLLLASGSFERARWTDLADHFLSKPSVHRGLDGPVIEAELCFFGCVDVNLAVSRDSVFALGHGATAGLDPIDLLEGRSQDEAFRLPADLEGSDMAFVGDGKELASLLDLRDSVLSEWLSALGVRVELRVDAPSGVRATARVTCEDPMAADDLAALFASAIANAHAEATASGKSKEADLLAHMDVVPGLGEFTITLDLPLAALERQFEGCRDEGE